MAKTAGGVRGGTSGGNFQASVSVTIASREMD